MTVNSFEVIDVNDTFGGYFIRIDLWEKIRNK